jgi:hypothetical protein
MRAKLENGSWEMAQANLGLICHSGGASVPASRLEKGRNCLFSAIFGLTRLVSVCSADFIVQFSPDSLQKTLFFNFGSHVRAYGSCSRTYGSCSRTYGSRSRTYGSRSRTYGSRSRIYGSRSRIYGSRSRAYGSCSRAYGSRSRAYGSRSRIYGSRSRIYGSRFPSMGNIALTGIVWNSCK